MAFDINTPERVELEGLKADLLDKFINSPIYKDDTDVARETFIFKIEMKAVIKSLSKLK